MLLNKGEHIEYLKKTDISQDIYIVKKEEAHNVCRLVIFSTSGKVDAPPFKSLILLYISQDK